MKKNLFSLFLWICVLCLMLSVLTLEDVVPIHYSINGDIDAYGSRYIFIFIHLLPLIVYYGMEFTKIVDPLKDNIMKKISIYELYRRGLSLFFIILSIYLTWITKFHYINNMQIICILLGLLLVGMGNYMPKLPQNSYLGLKTPWTLKNEYVWKKTHRLGGTIFVVTGLVYMFCAYINIQNMLYATTVVLIISCLFLYYYSFRISNDLKEEK